MTSPNIIAIPLGVSKIFDVEFTMNYIGKKFSRHFDVISSPIDTKLNYSFIASNYVTYSKLKGNRTKFAEITNMTLLVHVYIAQILPEPEAVCYFVYI